MRGVFGILLLATLTSAGCAPSELESGAQSDEDVLPIIESRVRVVDGPIDVKGDEISAKRTDVPVLAKVTAGDVLVSGKGDGLVRRVRSVRTEGDRVIAVTEPGSLGDVFQQVRLKGALDDSGATSTGGVGTQTVRLTIPQLDIKNKRIDLGASGELEIVDAGLDLAQLIDFDLTIRSKAIDHMLLSTTGSVKSHMRVRYALHKSLQQTGGVSLSSKEAGVPVYDQTIFSKVFWVGSPPFMVPIKVTGRLHVFAHYKLLFGGDVSGEENVVANGDLTAGVEYGGGKFKPIGNHHISVSAEGKPTIASRALLGEVALTGRVELWFAGIAGPYVGLEPYLAAGHEKEGDEGSWVVQEGVRGIVGAQAEVFGNKIASYAAFPFDVSRKQSF
mgnify:CR=1 FL=1